MEFRDQKRNTLIDLIDILDDNQASDYLLNEVTLAESMQMVSKNVYRTFSNKSKYLSNELNCMLMNLFWFV